MNKTFAPILSFVMAAVVTAAMLAGVNGLATGEAGTPQMARAASASTSAS
jgi:hypothetical protein